MKCVISQFLVLCLVIVRLGCGFKLLSNSISSRSNKNLLVSKPRDNRAKGFLTASRVDPDFAGASKPAWTQMNEPKTAREKAQFKNKIPFDENMYEVLKTAIELLSKRINGPEPLSADEAGWLLNAVEAILTDANMYGPPPKPPKSAPEES